MSLHAQLSEKAILLLRRQEKKSRILSAVIACLVILLIAGILALFAIPMMLQDTPTIVTYSAELNEDREIEEKKVVQQTQRRPSAPAQNMAKVIAANTASPTAIPVPDIPLSEPSMHFGDDMDFGQGWADNTGTGGGGAFGATTSDSGGLPGYLYDHKQDANRNPRQFGINEYGPAMVRIQRSGFAESELSRIFRTPKPLYLTRVAVPKVRSELGPEQFGAEKYVEGKLWFAHYRGTVTAPRDGQFRFVGLADDYLIVKVDGKAVLHGSLSNLRSIVSDGWKMPKQPGQYFAPGESRGNRHLVFGDWLDLRRGQPMKMDIAFGERPGGHMHAAVFIEEKGVEYRKASNGRPILPLFTTTYIESEEIEELKKAYGRFEIEFDWKKTPIFTLRN